MGKFKTELTEGEFREIKDLVCEACLQREPEHKQYFLVKIGGIMVGSEKQFVDSAEAQGYTISKGVKP